MIRLKSGQTCLLALSCDQKHEVWVYSNSLTARTDLARDTLFNDYRILTGGGLSAFQSYHMDRFTRIMAGNLCVCRPHTTDVTKETIGGRL